MVFPFDWQSSLGPDGDRRARSNARGQDPLRQSGVSRMGLTWWTLSIQNPDRSVRAAMFSGWVTARICAGHGVGGYPGASWRLWGGPCRLINGATTCRTWRSYSPPSPSRCSAAISDARSPNPASSLYFFCQVVYMMPWALGVSLNEVSHSLGFVRSSAS